MRRLILIFLLIIPVNTFADDYSKKAIAFIQSLKEDGIKDDIITKIKAKLEKDIVANKIGGEYDFIGESLLIVYRDYRLAVKKWYKRYHEQASESLIRVAVKTDNDFLLAHANFFLARNYLQSGQFEKAESILRDLMMELDYFHRDYEVVFYYGLATGQTLRREISKKIFTRFLKDYPNAPERYRILAKQIISQLTKRGENELYDLADRMALVRKLLSNKRSDKYTQEKQREIVKILDKLIKISEQQENSGKSDKAQKPNKSQDSAKGSDKSDPATKPAIPTGAVRPSKTAKVDARNVGRSWNQLREEERREITQFLNKNFPARYQELLKQYYKELNRND